MPLSFNDLQNEVLNHGFDESYRPRVRVWLNEAQQRVARAVHMPELLNSSTVTTTAGVNAVSIPAGLIRVVNIYDSTNKLQLEAESFLEVQSYGDSSGISSVYAIDEATGTFRLYPTPSGQFNLEIRHYAEPTDMTQADHTTRIASAYEDLLVTYALGKAYRAEDDFEASSLYRAQFVEDLARAQNDLQYRDITAQQVPGTWSR